MKHSLYWLKGTGLHLFVNKSVLRLIRINCYYINGSNFFSKGQFYQIISDKEPYWPRQLTRGNFSIKEQFTSSFDSARTLVGLRSGPKYLKAIFIISRQGLSRNINYEFHFFVLKLIRLSFCTTVCNWGLLSVTLAYLYSTFTMVRLI